MALITLVSVLALIATHSYAQSTLGSKAQAHAAVQAPVRPPVGLELPREEQGKPFYEADYGYHKSQPSEESGAPIYNEKLPTDQDYWTILAQAQDSATPDSDSYYVDLPSLPAQDLTPPLSVLQWNPDNDPTLYFQLPVEITKEAVPTNTHPKKYHKVLVEKSKPISGRPKEEISLIPVSEDELIRAEKQLQKTAYNQAKVEHHHNLQYEREQQVKQQDEEEDKVKSTTPRTKAKQQKHNLNSINKETLVKEKKYRAHYSANVTPKKLIIHAYPPAVSNKSKAEDAEESATGLWGTASPQSSSLGSHEGLGSHGGQRVDFQMRGHAGPYSYKFGFDTGKGKGHERQFRYEERDNHGYVKGHYGFYDKHGQLYMIKYDASPHDGFHADNGSSDGDSF